MRQVDERQRRAADASESLELEQQRLLVLERDLEVVNLDLLSKPRAQRGGCTHVPY